MFLGIGDKVKACRELYELKQASFSKFGISQHYLSMIERQQRQPTVEMIDQIYDAFDLLTNGEIRKQYTKETFRYTKDQQAEAYLVKRCEKEDVLTHYEDSVKIAEIFHLDEMLHQLNVAMGDYYQSNLNYDLSTNYFIKAIHDRYAKNRDLAYCYQQLGYNMRMIDNYKVALIYYTLAAQYTADKRINNYYMLRYYTALMNLELEQFNEAFEKIEFIVNNSEDLEIVVAAYMIKHYAYTKLKRYEESKQLMLGLIQNKKYEGYKAVAYHNLAYSLLKDDKAEEALIVIEKSIELKKTLFRKNLSLFLKGQIYFSLNRYEEAKECYIQSKEDVLKAGYQSYFKSWYEAALKLEFELRDHEQLYHLLVEIRDLVNQNRLNETFLSQMKLDLLTWCCNIEDGDIDQARKVCSSLLSI